MKSLSFSALLFALTLAAAAQDKPRVYVSGKGTQNVATNASTGGNRWFRTGHSESNVDAHDESMEVNKDLQKDCSGITVTLNESAADYTVMLDRESKQKRGLLRTNSQIQVANRAGDLLGASATRTVNSAAKDACNLILADWAQHGKLAPTPVSEEKPAPPAASVQAAPVQAAVVSTPTAISTPTAAAPTTQETSAPTQTPALVQRGAVISGAMPENQNPVDAAKRTKQHQACLKLAASNSSITCQ
jgi:hypothetical protein